MGTQGLLSVMKGGKVVAKVVTGSDGRNVRKIARALSGRTAVTGDELLALCTANRMLGPSLVIQMGHGFVYPCDMEDGETTDRYIAHFGDPEFNPRWASGAHEILEVVDLDAPTKSVRYAYPSSPAGGHAGRWYTLPDNLEHSGFGAAMAHAEALPGVYDQETRQIIVGPGARRYRAHCGSACPVTGATAWQLVDLNNGEAVAYVHTDGETDQAPSLPDIVMSDFLSVVAVLADAVGRATVARHAADRASAERPQPEDVAHG